MPILFYSLEFQPNARRLGLFVLHMRIISKRPLLSFSCLLLAFLAGLTAGRGAGATDDASRQQKRWLFVWRDMSKPEEVERMIARFPRAAADGYNGVVFSHNIAPAKAAELCETA